MMYYSFFGLMFGGSLLGLIALALFAFPAFRPVRLTHTIGVLCACMALPLGTGFLLNTGYPLLILRPAMVFLSLLVSIAYLVLRQRLRFPLRSTLPVAFLVLASLLDAYSIYLMSDSGFAGGHC